MSRSMYVQAAGTSGGGGGSGSAARRRGLQHDRTSGAHHFNGWRRRGARFRGASGAAQSCAHPAAGCFPAGCWLAATVWPSWARLAVQLRLPTPASPVLSLGVFVDLMIDGGSGAGATLAVLQLACQVLSVSAVLASAVSVALQAASAVRLAARKPRCLAGCGCCCGERLDPLLCASAAASGVAVQLMGIVGMLGAGIALMMGIFGAGDFWDRTACGFALCCLMLHLFAAWSEAVATASADLAGHQSGFLDLSFGLAAAALIGQLVAAAISLLTLRLEWSAAATKAAIGAGAASVASTSQTSTGRPVRLVASRARGSGADLQTEIDDKFHPGLQLPGATANQEA
uniref:GDT1 family protein n=1 Tax=Macrostomum lignano TaxID=282301 RepID=A0A1I8F7W2_9PLAT